MAFQGKIYRLQPQPRGLSPTFIDVHITVGVAHDVWITGERTVKPKSDIRQKMALRSLGK